MDRQPCILVVEDDRDIREMVARYLEDQGMRAVTLADGRALAATLEKTAVDLVILDLMLPGENGLGLCREIRGRGNLPIIMLTALDAATDRVVGLEMGADDYVTKPFDPRELLARIRAVLRRSGADRQTTARRGEEFRFDRWILSMARRELVDLQGVVEPLSSGEFDLLLAFVHHSGQVLSRERLLDLSRGRHAEAFNRSIDTQVMRLRRKLEEDPGQPRIIRTVWGDGYLFVPEVTRS